MDSHASNSLSSGKVLPDASSFQKKPEMPKRESSLSFAIAAIVLVGGTFFLLASYRVLPQNANLISKMGIWGKITGWGFIVLGSGTLVLSIKKPREQGSSSSKPQKSGKETSSNSANNSISSSTEKSEFTKNPVFPIAKQIIQSYWRVKDPEARLEDQEIENHYLSGFENLRRACQREINEISSKDFQTNDIPEFADLHVTIRCEYKPISDVISNFDQELSNPQVVFATAKPILADNLVTALKELKEEAKTRLENYFQIKDPIVLAPIIPGQMPMRVEIDFTLKTEYIPNQPTRVIGFKRLMIGWWGKVKASTLEINNENAGNATTSSSATAGSTLPLEDNKTGKSEQNDETPNTSTAALTASPSFSSSSNNNIQDDKSEESSEPANTSTSPSPSASSTAPLSNNNNSSYEVVDYSKIPDFLRFKLMLESYARSQQIQKSLSDREIYEGYQKCFQQLKKNCEEAINSIKLEEIENGISPNGEPGLLTIKIKCYYSNNFVEVSNDFGKPFKYEEDKDIFSGKFLSTKQELLQHFENVKKYALAQLTERLNASEVWGTIVPVWMPSRVDIDCRVTCEKAGRCISVLTSIGWWGRIERIINTVAKIEEL